MQGEKNCSKDYARGVGSPGQKLWKKARKVSISATGEGKPPMIQSGESRDMAATGGTFHEKGRGKGTASLLIKGREKIKVKLGDPWLYL